MRIPCFLTRWICGCFPSWIRIPPLAVEVRKRVAAGAFPPPKAFQPLVPVGFRRPGAIPFQPFSTCTKNQFPPAESADRLLVSRREIASQGVPLLARRPISSEKKARFIHSVQGLCRPPSPLCSSSSSCSFPCSSSITVSLHARIACEDNTMRGRRQKHRPKATEESIHIR